MAFPAATGSESKGMHHRRNNSNDKKINSKNNSVALKYTSSQHNYTKSIDTSNLLAQSAASHAQAFQGRGGNSRVGNSNGIP